MSWEKITDHLFDRYCVEGDDKELCNLMQEHDAEVRAKAIDEFAEQMKWEYRESIGTSEREIHFACAVIEQVAEQLKSDHILEVTKKVGEEGGR